MDYLLFTLPSCDKCDELKKYLDENDFSGEEYSLAKKEGRLKIKDYLRIVKRDDTGGIILPTLILQEARQVSAVVNSRQELDDWLRSKG